MIDAMMTTVVTAAEMGTLAILCDGHDVSDSRRDSLLLAIRAGAGADTLAAIRDAVRLARKDTIVIPQGRYEHCSRGGGWARKGKGDSAVWGERVDGGYRVGPGRWSVGSTDGFRRKDATDWSVKHVRVGDQTWSIAS